MLGMCQRAFTYENWVEEDIRAGMVELMSKNRRRRLSCRNKEMGRMVKERKILSGMRLVSEKRGIPG